MRLRLFRPFFFTLTVFLLSAFSFSLAENKPSNKAAKLPKRQVDKSKITWLSYDQGLRYAKSEKKHLFVDFTATWCGWCKRMDATTFQDSAVINEVNRSFVPVKVWGDTDSLLDIEGYQISQRDLAKNEFRVGGYPAFWFVSPEGQKIGPLPGYQKSDVMLKVFDYVRERKYDTVKTDTSTSDRE